MRSSRWSWLRALPPLVAAALLVGLGAPARLARAADSGAEAKTPAPRVLKLKLASSTYRAATLGMPALRIERVVDLRGGEPLFLGHTSTGGLFEKRAVLLADMPVAEFVARSLDTLLAVAGPRSDAPRLEIGIEQFDLGCQWGWSGAGDAEFRARLAVSVLSDSGATAMGWVEAREIAPKAFSIKGAQEQALYKGMVALARGLGNRELAAKPGADQPVLAAQIATGRQTVESEYQTGFELATRTHPFTRLIYLGPTGASMKDAYGGLPGFSFGSLTWFRNARSGLSFDITYAAKKGTPKVLDPSWTISSTRLELYSLPMSATYLYRLTGHGGSPDFAPFIGLGGGLIPGVERLKLKAERSGGAETIDGHLAALRFAAEAHTVLGGDFHVAEQLHGIIEGRWTFAGPGSAAEPVDENNATDVALADLLHSIVGRSDFNFTGWGVSLGLRWDLK